MLRSVSFKLKHPSSYPKLVLSYIFTQKLQQVSYWPVKSVTQTQATGTKWIKSVAKKALNGFQIPKPNFNYIQESTQR